MPKQRTSKSPIEGVIVGSVSGLVGTILMTQFQLFWKKASQEALSAKAKAEAKQSEKKKRKRIPPSRLPKR